MANYYIAPESSFDATADAIRAKTGSQASIEWTEDGFADAVAAIPTGNDREDLTVPKDVDFIDFDGRLLYSYTAQEFLALTALPANPSYPGLTAQGWNWTLADAKAFVGDYGALVIGQSYTTDDGMTRIYIHVTPQVVEAQLTFEIVATATVKNGLKIYWGDGNESVWSGNANANVSGANHVYTTAGDYLIEIEVLDGAISWLGRTGANSSILGGNGAVQGCVRRIEIGDDVAGLAQNTFKFMRNLEVLTIPTTVTSLNDYDESMFSCNWMRGIVFPLGFTTNRYRAMFPGNCTLTYISIPKSMHNFAIGTYPSHLRKLTIYSLERYSGTAMPKLHSSYNLTHFVVMGTWSTVDDDSLRDTLIKKLFIPATVTKINGTTPFAYNYQLEEVHLYPTTPPTLGASSAFNGLPANCVIYVPYSADHSILEAYQTATNWSTYASQMQEEPQ